VIGNKTSWSSSKTFIDIIQNKCLTVCEGSWKIAQSHYRKAFLWLKLFTYITWRDESTQACHSDSQKRKQRLPDGWNCDITWWTGLHILEKEKTTRKLLPGLSITAFQNKTKKMQMQNSKPSPSNPQLCRPRATEQYVMWPIQMGLLQTSLLTICAISPSFR